MSRPPAARDYFAAHLWDDTEDCILWPFSTSRGYGQMWRDGVYSRVHISACEAHHGPRPEGMQAAHGPCHNPLCFNGRHLSWRTPAENCADDRTRDGVGKLTAEQVTTIRARHASGGISQSTLAREYRVSRQTLSRVIARSIWKHVP